MQAPFKNQAYDALKADSRCLAKGMQTGYWRYRQRAADTFPLGGRYLNRAIAQDKLDIGQARLRTDFRFFPKPEVIPVFPQ
jgi:hypothetical protein